GKATPAKVAGKTYKFPTNDRKLEAVSLKSDDKGETLVVRFNGTDQRTPCGHGEWTKGRASHGPLHDQPAAATGGWTADDTYTAKICFTETPFIVKVELKFSEGEVQYDSESNVGFGATKQPRLTGKVE